VFAIASRSERAAVGVEGRGQLAVRRKRRGPAGNAMNDDRFDSLAKVLTSSPTRRKAFSVLAGSAGLGLVLAGLGLGGLAELLGVSETEARKNKHKKKRKKKKRKRRRRKQQAAGPALFPDLQVLPPSDLQFDRPGVDRLLRFTNTIWNAGPGRLELEGDVDPNREQVKRIFQNIYDAPVGGAQVGRQQINGTIIYHKEHGHFHFAEFASYVLLVNNGGGYVPLTPGTKTSFCITDNNPLNTSLPAQYTN
jgi:hypothetical protein